ncbi:hypothetical protein PVAND_015529 [Polypedilum vanderplanki]|uniref:Serpin domain-containing protein n=1 Tax=Polypedilum vanderplanki TaxID=319348 RepID=A0A9J6BDC6_POLVA|nr:hypothetical protein PVAND_015529 [Polypedilum vanderplanki]
MRLESFVLFLTLMSSTFAQDQMFLYSRQNFSSNLYKFISNFVTTNLVISPLSIDIALNMLVPGANGKTLREMMKTLDYPSNYSINFIQNNFRLFFIDLKKLSGLEIANKIYYNKLYMPQKNYENALNKNFNAKMESIDFSKSEAAANTINSWISNSTHNLIEGALDKDSLNNETSMVIINCIYLKATWQFKFNKTSTYIDTFYIDMANNLTTQVQYMTQEQKFNIAWYIDNLGGASAIELPYSTPNISMIIIMPHYESTLDALWANISKFDWSQIGSFMDNSIDVTLRLPKFNISFEKFIEKDLYAMGMHTLFDPAASILDHILLKSNRAMKTYISSIYHKAIINVDEEGTEAAAVTIDMARADFEFICNQPFMYMLKKDKTIFFMGQFTGR